MLYLIFSDVHGNLEALSRLLQVASKLKPDAFVSLGDLVGYGPNPNEVVNRVRKLSKVSAIRGNHDKVAAELEDDRFFNPVAAKAIRWTSKKLSEENLKYLKNLVRGPLMIRDDFTIFHGSFLDEDAYIFGPYEALLSLQTSPTRHSFFGHTHFPVLFRLTPAKRLEMMTPRTAKNRVLFPLDPESTYLINPGSVGQPRDRDPRLSFMTYDSHQRLVTYYRYRYQAEKTQAKIQLHKLPPFLGERLLKGV